MQKLPISALIVSRNEGHLLDNCLKSISFCDEIIVINLDSTDKTIEIAEKNHSKVITRFISPVVEMIRQEYVTVAKNDWILITDPDEVTSEHLAKFVTNSFHSLYNSSKIGVVRAPIIYYFKTHRLQGTTWGGIKTRTYLINRNRYDFSPNVHRGGSLRPGYSTYTIESDGENHINHFWMMGFRQIFEKHLRYLRNEGQSRFDSGNRTTFKRILLIPFRQFKNCYFRTKGYKDGFIGLFLSFFRAWYFTVAEIELFKYQLKMIKKNQ